MIKRSITVAMICFLTGCVSIPLGTMWRMMNFTPEDLIALDPSEMGVAVQIPDELALDDELVTFNVDVFRHDDEDKVLVLHEYAHLESVEKGRRVVAPLEAAEEGRHWHVLRLPKNSYDSFRRFQAEFGELWQRRDDNRGSFRITVNPKFVNQDSLSGSHDVTIALRFSKQEGWFDLLRDAPFDFDEIRRRRNAQPD